MKKTLASVIIIGLLSLGIISGGCNVNQKYYQKRTVTSKDLIKRWGRPVSIRNVDDTTKIYVFRNPDTYMRYRHFVVRDDIVVDEGLGM